MKKANLIIKFMIHMKRLKLIPPPSPIGNRHSSCCNLITTLVCFIPSLFLPRRDGFCLRDSSQMLSLCSFRYVPVYT